MAPIYKRNSWNGYFLWVIPVNDYSEALCEASYKGFARFAAGRLGRCSEREHVHCMGKRSS
jgi:hypothetical protein